MHRAMIPLAFVLVLLAGCVHAQPALTRLGVVSAVLEHRQEFYDQKVIVDGCSLASMDDLVTKEMGTIASKYADDVKGRTGAACVRMDTTSAAGPTWMLKLLRLSRGEADFVPEMSPEEAKSLITLTVRITNSRFSGFLNEEWALRQLPNGRLLVAAVRVIPGTR